MLARIRKATEEKESGFTLIELLVVMIIIGILAAIAIPVFLNQRAKARDTSTKADVSTVGKEIAAYYVDGTDGVSVAISGSTATISNTTAPIAAITTVTVSSGTAVSNVTGTGASNWCVAFTNLNGSSGTGRIWKYSAAGGLANGSCP